MAFSNSILAGEELVRSGIRSENYVPGVAGWRIGRDGTAEFQDAMIRGTVVVGVGDPRIEIIPDLAFGIPAILFYPDGGGPPAVIDLLTPVGPLAMISPSGATFLAVADAQLRFSAPALTLDTAIPANVAGDAFDLVTKIETVAVAPGGDLDVTSAAFAAWSPTISVTPPAWATRAHVSWTASAINPTGIGSWEIRCRLGGVAGRTKATTPSSMLDYSLQDRFTGLVGGAAINIEVQGRRTVGVSALRANVDSDFTYQITWAP